MNSYKINGLSLLLFLIFLILITGCGTKKQTPTSPSPNVVALGDLQLTAFDSSGNPSASLTRQLSITESHSQPSGSYAVSVADATGWSHLYLELKYRPTLRLTNLERGELFASGLMYYREVEPGLSILVLLNPGATPATEHGAGVVCTVQLQPATTDSGKSLSAVNTDTYVQETKEYEEGGQKYLEWTEVLRGDCNLNHKVDFADFGVIGARYNQTVTAANSAVDPNQNGKVEFSDFGEIGMRYNRLISGFTIYTFNNGVYNQAQYYTFTDRYNSITPSGKNEQGWHKYKVPVTWNSDRPARVEPISIPTGEYYGQYYYVVKNIGPAGGKIETPNFRLTVPAGAFDAEYQLTVQILTTNLSMFEVMCSTPYSISGLPEKRLKPLTVEFQYRAPSNQPLKGNKYVQIAEPLRPTNIPQPTWLYGYHTLEITQSGDWLQSTIPASDPDPVAEEPSGTTAAARRTSAVTDSFSIWAIAGYYSLLSSKKHFRITYPASDLIQGGAEQIADHLEASYAKLEALGFSWSARTRWPIEVSLQPLIGTDGSPHSRWGEYVPSRWGINHYSLNLNANNLNNQTEIDTMKLTASHELFHIVQAMYDARSWWSIATDRGRWYWMDEASAVWFETQMAPNPNEYIASVARDNADFLFKNTLDFHTGTDAQVEAHGYGASSFLKFFGQKYGATAIAELYKLHRKSTSYTPIDALETVSKHNLIVDWNQFCQDYFEGLLYPEATLSLANRLKTAQTFIVTRNVWSFDSYFPQTTGLTARLYAINFAKVKDTIPAKTVAYFSMNYPLTKDYAITSTVFRVKGKPEAVKRIGVLKKMGLNENNELMYELMSPDVKELAANGENLYVLIVNSDTNPEIVPGILSTEICVPSHSATAAIYKLNFTKKETTYYVDTKTAPTVTYTDNQQNEFGSELDSSAFQWVDEYHFKYLVDNGPWAKKYLEGELSEDKLKILWFKLEEQDSALNGAWFRTKKLEAKNIPLIPKNGYYYQNYYQNPCFIYRLTNPVPDLVYYFFDNHYSTGPILHVETLWENFNFTNSQIELRFYIPDV